MKKVISIDWLQLYCDCTDFKPNPAYTWKLHGYQTQQFRKVYSIIYQNEEIATATAEPSSHIMPKWAMIIKISNRELYGQNLSGLVSDLLCSNAIKFISLTRLDIAVDFQTFHNGLKPQNFIQRFMTGTYLKNGRGKYTLIGEQKHTHTFDYLRFGTKTSEANAYIYNKTKELEQVKDKPYIRKLWSSLGFNADKDVWRLEFSLKSKKLQCIELHTGEHTVLGLEVLDNHILLNKLFNGFMAQYFEFKVNDGKQNKSRMKSLILFDESEAEVKPLYLPKEPCGSKADKVFIKKLYQLDQELREVSPIMKGAANLLLEEFILSAGMVQFYEDKKVQWERDFYRP